MNVLEDPAGLAELQALGVRSVPVLSRGKDFVFGQSLPQIVAFLGLAEKAGPALSVDDLCRRLDKFMSAAIALLPLMPADRLHVHVPGRPRSYRALAWHLFKVVDAYLDAERGTSLEQAAFREEPAADAAADALVGYGTKVQRRFQAWQSGGDRDPARSLATYYGAQSLHELLERTTWHCGQHVRQWMMLLEREGASFDRPLSEADFARLPMPANVWDG